MKAKIGSSFNEWLEKEKRDPVFKVAYDRRTMILALASRLKELREQRNVSQPELARRTGIRQAAISRLERPKATASLPSIDTLARIGAALGFHLEVNFKEGKRRRQRESLQAKVREQLRQDPRAREDVTRRRSA